MEDLVTPPQVDEYGIPIRKATQPAVDEYGIPIKKKVSTSGSAPTSDLSGSGLNPFQSTQQQPNSAVYLPGQVPAQPQQPTTRAPLAAESAYWKMLSPQEQQALNSSTQQAVQTENNQGIRATTQQEQGDYAYGQTLPGKIQNGLTYLAQKATKGGLQVVKGAAYLAQITANAQRGLGLTDTHDFDNAFKSADNATDFLSKTSENQVEQSKTMTNIGGLAEFLPAAAAASGTGGATLYLQGIGQGKEIMDNAEAAGAKIDPTVKTAFILGTGAVNGLLMGDLGHGIFNTLGASLKDDVVKNITMNAIKEAAGKDLTAEGFTNLLKQGAQEWGDKALQGGVNFLKSTKRAITDLSALNVANFALKKGVDVANDQPVFNQTTGDLVNQEAETLKAAPLFGAVGSLSDVSKLTPFSQYKNVVMDNLIQDSSDANVANIKQNISEHGLQQGWTPEEIVATNDHIDKLAAITKSIPKGLPEDKANKAVDLVIGRNDLQKQLEEQQVYRTGLTAPFNEEPSPGEQLLQNKIDQANDKLRTLATGDKATYSKGTQEDEGLFFKTVNGVKEEIPQHRYDIEVLDRKTEQPITNEQTTPNQEVPAQTPEVPAAESNQVADVPVNEVPANNQVEPNIIPKGENQDAIPEQTTGKVGVRDETAIREGVGGQDQSEVTPTESKPQPEVGSGADAQHEEKGISPTKIPEGLNEREADDWVAKNGTPNDIAARYHQIEPKEVKADTKEQGIIDYLGAGGKINLSDYKRYGDSNKLSDVSQWVDKKNSDKTDLATHAETLSEKLGEKVTPQDFVDFIEKYKNKTDFEAKNTDNIRQELADRYKELTGKNLTDKRAEDAHNKQFNPKELTQQEVDSFNASAKEIGITNQDIDNYEQSIRDQSRTNEPVTDKVSEPKSNNEGSTKESAGDKGVQAEQPKISDKAKELADRIRALKSDKSTLHGGLEGVATAVWDGALETVATTIEAGGKLIDAINEGVKHILDAHPELKEDEVRKKLSDEINGVTEEPIPEEEGVKKTILTKRAYEGDISDDVKKYLEEKGLKRTSFSQEERSKQATDFINKFGEDAAFRAVESGDVEGGMAASILAQLQISNSRAMSELPEGSDERDELAKKQSDYIALMEKKGYLGGEFNGQLAHEYQNAELNYAEVKRQVEKSTGKPLTPGQEETVKRITDQNEKLKAQLQESETKLIDETDKAFKAGQEAAKNETNTQKAKRIADKIRDNAKIHRPGVFSSATPASLVWDAAVEITAKSIETGGKIADAIDTGIKHIKSTDWYKSLPANKKALAESEFKRVNNNYAGSTDLADLQARFVDKTDNKFSPDEARDIWGYMKKTYLENGTSYRDALSKTSQDLGLSWRQISEAITTPKLKRASDEMWKKQADLTRARTGIKNWIEDQNKSVLGKALQKASGLFRGISVFGHGGIFVGTHAGMTLFNPSTWNKTIPAFFRGWKFAYGNEGDYQRSIEELKNSPNYLIAQRAGLKNNPERINAEEYQKSQKYLGKLGLAGEKGFNAIKVLRQDLFDYHFNKLTPAERDDPAVAKSIAHLVNLSTGATNINIPSWVNEASFAGGMEASRWEKLTASPVKATTTALNAIFDPSKATTADRVFAKVWSRRIGEQLATYTGLLLANAAVQNNINPKNKVNLTDPSKPDFLKFKLGTVTIDPTSGMRSTAMFMYKLGQVPFESKAERHGDNVLQATGKDVAGYARGKLAPLYSTAADVYSSQDFSGNTMPYSNEKPPKYAHKLTWGEYAWSKAPLPIAEAAKVAYDSAIEHGAHKTTLDNVLKGIMSGAISGTTGVRVGEYDANAPENKKKH